MATAEQVIKAALQRILVEGSEADFEPDEYSDAIFAMNNLMLEYDARGIKLGYTEVSTIGDTLTIPVGALRGLIANLAVEIAPDYEGEVTPALAKAAAEGRQTMELLGVSVPQTAYPSTLPVGSGNISTPSWSSSYYADMEAEILAETTGSIALETNISD